METRLFRTGAYDSKVLGFSRNSSLRGGVLVLDMEHLFDLLADEQSVHAPSVFIFKLTRCHDG